MGTYYTNNASRADIQKEILSDIGDRLVDSACKREDSDWVLWTVEKGEKDGEPYQFIGCYLLCPAGVDAPSGWGYKPMDETMGPFYYSVPRAWLINYPCIMVKKHESLLKSSEKWRKAARG